MVSVYVYVFTYVCGGCYLYAPSSVNGSSSPHGWTGKAVIRKQGVKIEQLAGTSPTGWIQACGLLFVHVSIFHSQGVSLSIRMPVNVSPVSGVWVLAPSDQLKTLLQWHFHIRPGNCKSCSRCPLISEQLVVLVYNEICGVALHSWCTCASLARYNNLCGNEMFSNGTADKYCN